MPDTCDEAELSAALQQGCVALGCKGSEGSGRCVVTEGRDQCRVVALPSGAAGKSCAGNDGTPETLSVFVAQPIQLSCFFFVMAKSIYFFLCLSFLKLVFFLG